MTGRKPFGRNQPLPRAVVLDNPRRRGYNGDEITPSDPPRLPDRSRRRRLLSAGSWLPLPLSPLKTPCSLSDNPSNANLFLLRLPLHHGYFYISSCWISLLICSSFPATLSVAFAAAISIASSSSSLMLLIASLVALNRSTRPSLYS